MKSFILFLAAITIVFMAPVSLAQPSIGGFNVYYGHLHNHCNVSDGTGTPDNAYNYAKNTAHLDFFSLADHSGSISATEWIAMQTAADSYNQPGVFTAFRGFEWTSSGTYGHVAVINTSDYTTTSSPTNTFSALCDWLNARECVAFFNHPGRENAGGTEFSHFSTTPSQKLVGMELWNKNDAFSEYYYNDGYYASDGNKGYYDEAITRSWRIGASGSEDNHSGTWGTYNNYRLAVLAAANTRDDIYNAFKAKRFFTTLDKNIALSFKINGNEMGSTLLPGTYALHIQASDGDGEIFTTVKLLKNGAVVNTWTPNSPAPDITENLAFTNAEYYYIIVKQSDGNEAISSPIWISDGNLAPAVSITSPAASAVFPAPATITILADASDPDGTITKVAFYQGTTLLGEDLSIPYSFTWSTIPAGTYVLTAKATDNLGAVTTSLPVSFTVVNPGEPVTVSASIASGPDDAEESAAGAIYNNSTDIELVYDTYNAAGNQTVGLRFLNPGIPQNAMISNAYVQFTCDEVTTGACSLVIRAEASDNSPAFTTAAFNISGRQKTASSIAWTPPAWSTANAATADQRTPDIAAMIREVVNRAGYSSSSAISIIITGTGTRTAEAYEGVPTSAAKLFVTYSYPVPNQPPAVSITSPANGSTFAAPATITITATASDADGEITGVEFYAGSTLLGTDYTSPYELTWSNVAAGSYLLTAKATDDDGALTISTGVSITVETRPVSGTFTQRIATGADDVEESSKGVMLLNSDDIELVYDTKTTGNQVVGLRFTGVTIPQGATVTSASLQFTVDEPTIKTCKLTIKGEYSDNAAPFTSTKKNVSGRIKTAASVVWTPAGWTTAGLAGAAQKSPDLKTIVQQIISRTGWKSGNSMVFIFTGTGTRTAVACETSSAKAALLVIDYTTTGGLKSEISEIPVNEPRMETVNLKCYPVPFTDRLHIEFIPAQGEQMQSIEIVSQTGSRIVQHETTENQVVIELPGLVPGNYILRVQTNKGSYSRKLIRK